MACRGGVFTLVLLSGACSHSDSPQDRCQQFLTLTQNCYAMAGQPIQVNPAACSMVTAQQQAQIDCSLQHQSAYCKSIEAAFGVRGDGGVTIDPHDPDLIGLNACISDSTTVSPCKDAIATLAQCGVAINFAPDCTGASAALAKCVVDNSASACAAVGGGADASAGATMAFLKCEENAASDAGAD